MNLGQIFSVKKISMPNPIITHTLRNISSFSHELYWAFQKIFQPDFTLSRHERTHLTKLETVKNYRRFTIDFNGNLFASEIYSKFKENFEQHRFWHAFWKI